MDNEHPSSDAINFNIDLQKYYAPLISSNVKEEISSLLIQFEEEDKLFISLLKEKGLI